MEKLKLLPIHKHPLLPFARFDHHYCTGCRSSREDYLYGGYICNELECGMVFHSSCAESVPEINHFSHPEHPLKLICNMKPCLCSLCESILVHLGYTCLKCDFNLHLRCAKTRQPLPPPPVQFKVHDDHPLQLLLQSDVTHLLVNDSKCELCKSYLYAEKSLYQCIPCQFLFHVACVELFPEGYHISHSKHPLKFLTCGPPGYSEKKCLLCGDEFQKQHIHHCDVCNFSICARCGRNPPPLEVVSPTTHNHTLHVVPRVLEFTCNACGTRGDRSPYFCLQCNFMIHRECIDLPRVIHINRHDHRIAYTNHLGHGNWTCGVCRKDMDGFYGGYSCSKCPNYVAHSRCATRRDVWDRIELEGTPEEEEEMEPFQVIDDYTIKHFSHDHNLKINRDGKILQESILCEACVFQICDDPFYSCEQCDFILHETCAHLRPKRRHVANNIPFTLEVDSLIKQSKCYLCDRYFTGFKYISRSKCLDVRCGSLLEPFLHKSHTHNLYYRDFGSNGDGEDNYGAMLSCDECSFTLSFWWAFLPEKVMNKRYDDHPLILSYGENNVSLTYWCDVCETKLDPKEWFYTCDDCGITLHVSCIVGDLTFHKPWDNIISDLYGMVVVANSCIRRPICINCGSRCNLPFIAKFSKEYGDVYLCSRSCAFIKQRGWSQNYS